MRIAVVAPSPVPFREGGAERLTRGLAAALRTAGHAVDVIKLPVREFRLVDLVAGYERFATLDLAHFDVVISGKYPAWMVDHPAHVVWMLHPLRGLYDSYPAGNFVDAGLPDRPSIDRIRALVDRTPTEVDPADLFDAVFAAGADLGESHPALAIPSPLSRAVVHQLDRIALSPRRIRRYSAISATVAGRTDYLPSDVAVRVLHPPIELRPNPPGPYGRRFMAVSRLERPKRLDLVIRAFAEVRGDVRLEIIGEGADAERLAAIARPDPRVSFAGRLDDEQLAARYAGALAVVFCPRDEDFGYVTLEAMTHERPVVTTDDAGGPAELVSHDVDGLVVEPTVEALAGAMQHLADDPTLAPRLGRAGAAVAGRTTWPAVVDELVTPRTRRTPSRPHLVAVSTYPLYPRQSGGQLRGWHLLRQLCSTGEITAEVVSATVHGTTVSRHHLSRGLGETVVPLSARHTQAETDLRLVAGPVSITDIAVSLMWRATPALTRELTAALESSTGVMLVQPYLATAVAELAPGIPSVCDEHNHERALKSGILPSNEAGEWLLGRVADVERQAVTAASLVTATTDADLASVCSEYGVPPDRGFVIANGVDVNDVPFVGPEERRAARARLLDALGLHPSTRAVALFIGSGHLPNTDAGRSIIESAPGLGHVEFVLAGLHCEELRRPNLPANVHLLGQVDADRLALLLAGADVALNPMRTGGGSNLKLLTYLAAGLPVVSSAVGTRGIDAVAAGVRVAEDDQLGAAIDEVLADRTGERAVTGRSFVEEHADWTAIGRRFSDLVLEHVLA